MNGSGTDPDGNRSTPTSHHYISPDAPLRNPPDGRGACRSVGRWDSSTRRSDMDHEELLVVSTRGESIGKVIHHDGDETFLVEGGTVFPRDLTFHYESSTAVSEDGALVYTLTEY